MTEAMRRYLDALHHQRAQHDAAMRLAEARRWPSFREYEAAIAKAMRADPDLSLPDAYARVLSDICLGDESRWALTPDGFVRR